MSKTPKSINAAPDPVVLPPAQPFALSRLGQVALLLAEEGEACGHDGMVKIADICLRRGHDPDPDLELLIRHVLFNYANSRNINVLSLPIPNAH